MKRTRGKDIKIVRKAARAKLVNTIKEAGKAQRRIRKHSESLEQQVEQAVKAVDAVESNETLAAIRQFESLNKRACSMGAECVFAKDGEGRKFTPAMTVSGISTETHCSVECASKRMGINIDGFNKNLEQAGEGRKGNAAHLAAFRRPSTVKEFAIGAKVVYLGGARTAKFKEGEILTVLKKRAEGRRYRVKSESGVRSSIGSSYLEVQG